VARSGQERTEIDFVGAITDAFNRHEALLLRPREAARMLGISERTLRRRVAQGAVTAVRSGGLLRFRVDDLKEFANARAS
jgi:excisionase family DNA binding protein